MILTMMTLFNGVNSMLETLVLKRNFLMQEPSSNSLIKTMIGRFLKNNFLKLKSSNWPLLLEVEEKEENELAYH
jgi:hypothetical protein